MGNWKEGVDLQFGLRHKDSCAKEGNPDPGVHDLRAIYVNQFPAVAYRSSVRRLG